MRNRGINNTLEKLIREAIEIDDKLYERAIEKRYIGIVRGRTSYVPYSRTRGQRRNLDAIEIDNIKKRPKKGRKDGGLKKGK